MRTARIFIFADLDDRPDGRKKAYVRLTADFDALEVANKVGDSLLHCYNVS